MRKKYSLIFHNQGPLIQEYINFGMTKNRLKIFFFKKLERYAFVNAISLHFPSNGACETYFNNQYACCKKNEVRLASPLFNIILPTIVEESKQIVLKKDDSCVTLFSVGTLTQAKGQDRTIQFLARIIEQFEKPIRYVLVGNGPLKKSLLFALDEIKKEKKCFNYYYYESLKHEDVMYLHYISDIYIMLHRISIFDIATLEAMSQNSMIILSKTGGNIDFNKDNNIFYADDYQANDFKFTSNLIDVYKEKTRYVFNNFFSKEAFINQYVVLIDKFMS